MIRKQALGIVIRMAAGYLVGILLVTALPGIYLKPVAPIAALMVNLTSPHLTECSLTMDGTSMNATANLSVVMTRVDGQPVPVQEGRWSKGVGATLHILVVGLAMWAAPSASRARRLGAFAVFIILAGLIGAADLAVQMQSTSLQVVGAEWLPKQSLASTDANHAAFAVLKSRYETTRAVSAFLDGGGRLFLGVLAGWIGYACPAPRKRMPIPV